VHIDATWRIRLNHPCAAAMRPYVKLLWPLVIIINIIIIIFIFSTSHSTVCSWLLMYNATPPLLYLWYPTYM